MLCQMHYIKCQSRENALAQNRSTHYYGQIRLPDKGRAIIELVICCVLLNLIVITRVFGQKMRDIAIYKYPWWLHLMCRLIFTDKILLHSKLMDFSILGKIHIGPGMVVGCFISKSKSQYGFRPLLSPILPPLSTDTLNIRGATDIYL